MIRPEVREIEDWLRQVRRDFHRHPELRFQETRTAEKVAEHLRNVGLEVRTGVGTTGVVGLFRGGTPGKSFAIRADMDALPIQEETGATYASCKAGVMHACGHDAHMAMALGTARALATSRNLREQISGQVKFIFQPGEEGGHGAREMISDGVLENPKVDLLVAVHVAPLLPFGKVGIYLREACASADSFDIRITGKGAHAAYPHLSRDPILGGAHLITSIQSLVSRNTDPGQGLVVSVTKVNAGTATNVIPDEILIAGTIRALSEQVRELAFTRLRELVHGVCQAHGLTGQVTFGEGYPIMRNHEPVSRFIAEVAKEMLGEDQVLVRQPKFGSEDLAYFLERCPGAGYELGCSNEAKGITHMLHTSRFDMDEDVMPLGVELYLRLIEHYFQ
ncbi:MAG: amidohydrolase [Deltaproteobacteria bacterium]|nr:MAG: amidohydrolase [Deltaproteobacteria bacterium]